MKTSEIYAQRPRLLSALVLALALVGTLTGCGQRAPSKLKIIGGIAVEENDPIASRVAALVTSKHVVQCTVAALGPSTFITAAHCIYGKKLEGWTIESGLRAGDGESLPVLSGEIHTKYDPASMRTLSPDLPPNDIAIIKTSEPTRSIIPVPIIRKDLRHLTRPALKVTVAGYGRTDGLDPESTGTLQKVVLAISSFNKDAHEFTTISDEGKMACHVDSGGPAFMYIGKELTLVGTISRGDRSCTSGSTVFTDISQFREFVSEFHD